MKKLFSAISALLCVVILTSSFSAATDAYTLYTKSMKKMDSVSSLEMQGTTKVYVEMYGTEFTAVKRTINIKMMVDDSNGLQLEAHTVDKQDPVDMYYYKGYMYRNMDGKKEKVKMSMDDALESSADIDRNAVKEQFEDAKVERVDGGYKIKYMVDVDDVLASNGDTIEALLGGNMPAGMDVSVSNASSTLTIADDYTQKAYATTYTITVSAGGDSLKMRYNSSGRTISTNSVKQIKYPADLASYKKVRSL